MEDVRSILTGKFQGRAFRKPSLPSETHTPKAYIARGYATFCLPLIPARRIIAATVANEVGGQ
jgi:hypothetical protein